MSHPKETSSKLDDELNKLFPANDITNWKLLEGIKNQQKPLFIALAFGLILLIALLTQSHKEKQMGSKIEHFKEQWMVTNSPRAELLTKLEPLLGKHKEGFSGWKGSLMQSALIVGQTSWVEKWRYWPSEKESVAIPELAFLWKASSQAALLAAQKETAQALALVEKTLQEAPAASSEAEKMLLSQLHLQKAMLYQSLDQTQKELGAWQELLALLDVQIEPSLRGAGLKKPLSGWQDQWVQSWSESKVSLLDYVAYRLKIIGK
jgi:hypothetical protein